MIWHLTTASAWESARNAGRILPRPGEGFIHCSYGTGVEKVIARHYPRSRDVVLLEVNPRKLSSPVRWENDDELFPHVYGEIPMNAVEAEIPLPCGADGLPCLPAGILDFVRPCTHLARRALLDFLLAEERLAFAGWDFSHVTDGGRQTYDPLPWSYGSEVIRRLPMAGSLLDMGTGGGEFLATLGNLPSRSAATEQHAPNVPVARRRLEPLGVAVHEVRSDSELPFSDSEFSLVINRHESFDAREVMRILRPGGVFLTQQIGGDNDRLLAEVLGVDHDDFGGWCLEKALQQVRQAGLQVEVAREARSFCRYFDLGALVFYLKAVPWVVEGFSVERYFDLLLPLARTIERDGFLAIPQHRFLVVARKP